MAKPKPIPSTDQIAKAIDRAAEGKGRQLAEIVKGISTDDLATAFGHVRAHWSELAGLSRALAFASGVREQRAIQAKDRRQWRKERLSS